MVSAGDLQELRVELFDFASNLGERDNLAEKHPEIAKELLAKYRKLY